MAIEGGLQLGEGTILDSPIGDTEAFICEVVTLISDATGADPLELPPVFEAVDPEAAQQVLESGGAGPTKVSFRYAGCEVIVTSDSELFVLDEPTLNE